MKQKFVFALVLALLMSLTCLAGCGAAAPSADPFLSESGVLHLRVNPEIAIHYDGNGNVTKVEGRNDDGSAILKDYAGYEGKAARTVITELVTAIGEAGYFVEEVEGERRQITIEIEPGSAIPSDTFLQDVVNDARACANDKKWVAPVELKDNRDDGHHENDWDGRLDKERNDWNDGICTNPNCKDRDCDDLICDAGICTNPHCDDLDCDDANCDDDDRLDRDRDDWNDGICTNPNCKDPDCDDLICDAGICTNPYCDDLDCDDADCDDDDRLDRERDDWNDGICTNPNCKDRDCDDLICDAGICTNPYCDDLDCDDADCDDDNRYEDRDDDDWDDHDD